MVFLAPTPDSKKSKENGFCYLSYQDFSDKILTKCALEMNNEYYKKIVNDFICCLSQPVELYEKEKIKTSKETIARSLEEKNISRAIVKKYKKQLIEIMNEKLGDSKHKVYDSNKNTFKGLFRCWYIDLEELNKEKGLTSEEEKIKDDINKILYYKTKIKYNGIIYVKKELENKNNMGKLIHDMIKNYVVNKSDITYNHLDKLLNEKKWNYSRNKNCTVIKKEKFELLSKDDKSRFFNNEEDIITLNDKEKIYVFKYWAEADVKEMANLLEQKIELL